MCCYLQLTLKELSESHTHIDKAHIQNFKSLNLDGEYMSDDCSILLIFLYI